MAVRQSQSEDDLKSAPIEFEYLTYDTELPSLSRTIDDGQEKDTLPSPPDLAKYQDPFTWSRAQKQSLVWQSVVGTALTAYSAGSYAPAVDQMVAEWGYGRVEVLVGITLFTIGFGVAPMILGQSCIIFRPQKRSHPFTAPFSEINGRRPVFVVAGIIFVVCVACCAATQLYAGMMVSRLLGGLASSVFSTMVGGVVADIYEGICLKFRSD